MTFDWDEIDAATTAAANQTDDQLAGKISSLTRLKDEEIKALFPTPADAAKLTALMKIVHAKTGEAERVNNLVANVREVAPAILKLLKALV